MDATQFARIKLLLEQNTQAQILINQKLIKLLAIKELDINEENKKPRGFETDILFKQINEEKLIRGL